MKLFTASIAGAVIGGILGGFIPRPTPPLCLPHQGVGVVVCCRSMFCVKQLGASTESPDPWVDNMGHIYQTDGGTFCMLTDCAP